MAGQNSILGISCSGNCFRCTSLDISSMRRRLLFRPTDLDKDYTHSERQSPGRLVAIGRLILGNGGRHLNVLSESLLLVQQLVPAIQALQRRGGAVLNALLSILPKRGI